ncbi:MAG: PaaI family thioesterase [Propionibacteriaceae bacterium]|nr:PaaI family thioesterase [Propionibacteriaceae bacterium]
MGDTKGFVDNVGIEVSGEQAILHTGPEHENSSGGIQGGLIATLLDIAMGRKTRAAFGQDATIVTLQLSVTYLNAAKPGDVLTARAELGKKGTSVAMLRADVVDAEGTEIAHGVGTFMVKGD